MRSHKERLCGPTETNLFHDLNLKVTNRTDLQVCEAISLLAMCVKFCLDV